MKTVELIIGSIVASDGHIIYKGDVGDISNDFDSESCIATFDGHSVYLMKDEYKIVSISNKTGTKDDSNKPRISLIPKEALWGMANAFTYGANKYAAHNFKNGIAYSRLADAAMRHLSTYMDGENIDEESGNCHLDHALASLAMLKFMSVNRKENDDRYIPEPAADSEEFEVLPGIMAKEVK